ncbi:hypothetical protein [Nitrosarchaeum koreense]|uniref:Uncharacterized protein n=1 Tax=Nitrosarchaeum koreense MY1 TaxID=1001994 RepID=F9CVR6_9ARCH|nr:hypothetical protein [Nitrosarchaeum koreense]EGP93368.1 hypothetical protein MY1_0603 [Nitrosarchaeum koreense MY1]
MNIEIIKQRLATLIDSKSQNEKKINELSEQAEILKKRLQIDNSK